MSDEIQTEQRQEVCQGALDMQAACLRIFDAAEAGDLVAVVAATLQLQHHMGGHSRRVKPLIAAQIRGSLPFLGENKHG